MVDFICSSSIDVFGHRQTDLLTERTVKSDEISQLKSDNLVISESCTGLQREKEHLLLEVGRLVRVPYRLARSSMLILCIRLQQRLTRRLHHENAPKHC